MMMSGDGAGAACASPVVIAEEQESQAGQHRQPSGGPHPVAARHDEIPLVGTSGRVGRYSERRLRVPLALHLLDKDPR